MDNTAALVEAQRAVSLIHRDPPEASKLASQILADAEIDPNDREGRGARALAHAVSGRLQIDRGFIDAAAAELSVALGLIDRVDAEVKAYVLLTAVTVAIAEGRLRDALRFVDDALATPTVDVGNGRTQKALILQRLGETHQAIEEYAAAEILLSADDAITRVRLLLNRGAAYGHLGRLSEAAADLENAQMLADRSGLRLLAAKATHNLGYIAGLRGDLIPALDYYAEANRGYQEAGAGTAMLSGDRGGALAAAGLFREARADIKTSIQDLLHRGLVADCTDTRIQDVRLALAVGDFAAAELTAGVAEREFRTQGRERWAAVARGYRIVAAERARLEPANELEATASDDSEATDATDATDATEDADLAHLAHELENLGWASLAWSLRSVMARHLEARGEAQRAETALAPGNSMPTDFSAQLAYGEAQIQRHRIAGRVAEAREVFARSIALLDEHRSGTGSAELRARATALANDLLDAALTSELSIGDAAEAMHALDAYRDATMRLWPLYSSGAGENHVGTERPSSPIPASAANDDFRREDELIRSDRLRPAPQSFRAVRRVDPDRSLGPAGRLAMFFVRRGMLEVMVREADETFHRVLCRLDDVTVGIERLRALLGPAFEAGTRGARAKRRLVFECEELSELLVAALPSARSNEPLVIVPDPSIAGCPWGMLDALREGPFVVAPSLASWRRASQPVPLPRQRVALISGPRLLGAEREVRTLRERFGSSAAVLVGPDATSKATLDAFASSDLVHLAAHGHFRDDHPLLSGLELVDRTVFGYDVDRLERTPHVVVLSACGVAQHDGQPGSYLGLAAVFLAHGTGTVVAPLVDVPDEPTADLMMRFHELLPAVGPAAALARLRTTGDEAARLAASAFIAIGAG